MRRERTPSAANVAFESLDADNLVILTNRGYIKRMDPGIFASRTARRAGRTWERCAAGTR